MSAASHTEEKLSINWICKVLRKEIGAPALQSIPPDTFQRIASAVGHLSGQGFEGLDAGVRDRIIELMSDAARILIQARMQKIASSTESLDYSKLTDEEKYILYGKNESAERVDEIVSAVKTGRPKALESACTKARSKKVIIRFVKPMDQFIGVDMTKYGPYLKEDVASLPFENARSFIGSGIAFEIQANV